MPTSPLTSKAMESSLAENTSATANNEMNSQLLLLSDYELRHEGMIGLFFAYEYNFMPPLQISLSSSFEAQKRVSQKG